jgi:hypothetical protein
MTDGEPAPSLGEPLEHATQRSAQDGGVLAHQIRIGPAQRGQVPAVRVLVGRAPAILDAGTQPGPAPRPRSPLPPRAAGAALGAV